MNTLPVDDESDPGRQPEPERQSDWLMLTAATAVAAVVTYFHGWEAGTTAFSCTLAGLEYRRS
ncbi:hypothetical protein [Nocardia noduli]|uniref:hypothetical protein n=1 Tax=Nocardia noduli TaxID=2815722 RepID=UPI001C2504C5|nr:hypothetical protein [Nocardia noduli]